MKNAKEIIRWLKANNHQTGGLTSHDVDALCASVALCPLISWTGAPPQLFDAYRAIVSEMQVALVPLAFEAIAIELDWGHREMIFTRAGLEINFRYSAH